jgi:uncharacterized protein YkwD
MLIRWLLLCFALAGFLLPAVVNGQAVEEEESESNRFSAAMPGPGAKVPDLAQVVMRIISHTNEFRQTEGRQKVEPSQQLMETARDFAQFMARTDKYGHTADGNRPAARAKQHGYHSCVVAENIAYQSSTEGFTTEELAQEFFQGWQQSPGHRQNMLDAAVTETGVAVARSEQTGYYYAVQMFGLPKSQMIEFQITNQSNVVIEYEIGGQKLSLPPWSTRTHQQCRSAEVTFQGLDMPERPTVQPHDGDHYAIVQEDSGIFRLQKQ